MAMHGPLCARDDTHVQGGRGSHEGPCLLRHAARGLVPVAAYGSAHLNIVHWQRRAAEALQWLEKEHGLGLGLGLACTLPHFPT